MHDPNNNHITYKLKIDSYVNPFEINNILDLNDSLSITVILN